jgi:hypothetical protein
VSSQSGGFDQQFCAKFHEEVQAAKTQHNGQSKLCDTDEGIASDSESAASVPNLMQMLQHKDQRIIMLEAQVQNVSPSHFRSFAQPSGLISSVGAKIH